MNWRHVLVAVPGLAVFLAAVAALVDPTVASRVPVAEAVSALGYDYLLPAIVGAAAIVPTGLVLAARAVGGLDQAEPPAPEGIESVPRLGADVDAVVEDGVGVRGWLLEDAHAQVRDRLRETAVGTVMRVEGCGRPEARRLVATGSWTGDPEAATFLAEGSGGAVAWRTRLRAAVSGTTPFRRGVRRTADAIVSAADAGVRGRSAAVDGDAVEADSTDGSPSDPTGDRSTRPDHVEREAWA